MTLNNLYIIGGLLLALYFIAGMGFLLFSREYILYIFYLELMYLIIMYSIAILTFFLNYDLLYSIMVILVIATIENCILILILILMAQEVNSFTNEQQKIDNNDSMEASKLLHPTSKINGIWYFAFVPLLNLFELISNFITKFFPHWLPQIVVWLCIIWAILYGMGRGGNFLRNYDVSVYPGSLPVSTLLNIMLEQLKKSFKTYKWYIFFIIYVSIDSIINYTVLHNSANFTRSISLLCGFIIVLVSLSIFSLLMVIHSLYFLQYRPTQIFLYGACFIIFEVLTDLVFVAGLLVLMWLTNYVLLLLISVIQFSFKFLLTTYILDYLLLYVLTLIPVLLSVAYVILWERKLMASVQRRRGPNVVGVYGLLQPIIDAVKLLLKEVLIPNKVNQFLFILGPTLTLVVALTLWTFIPFSSSNYYYDYEYGLLLFLGVSSLGPYGIIIAGWSSNSSYAALGATRSIAQFISYEAIIGLLILPVIMYCESLNFIEIVLFQEAFMWFFFPLFPICIWFFVAILAETNRTPFDLPEAEAELVAGYNTEYAGVFFIMFMLAEYSNILCMSSLIVLLFFGGWTLQWFTTLFTLLPVTISSVFFLFLPELILSIKLVAVTFLFILVRATLPRFRFDQLMFYCWCNLLPLILGVLLLIIFVYILTVLISLATFI